MKNDTFNEIQDRFLMQILGIIFVLFLAIWIFENFQINKEVMAINFCFKELADGSIYHYVCEK